MPINRFKVFSDDPTDEEIQRRELLAQALMQQAMPQRQPYEGYQGRMVPQYGIGQALLQVGAAALGRREQKRAEQARSARTDRKRQALADALGLPRAAQIEIADPMGGPSDTRTVPRAMTDEQRRISGLLGGMDSSQMDAATMAMFQQHLQPNRDRLVQAVGADGRPQYVRESEAVGMQPFSGATEAKPPASIAEYQLAKSQGYQGTFQEWQREQARGVVVEYGGAKWLVNPVTKEAIPLSTPDEETRIAAERREAESLAGTRGSTTAQRWATQIDEGFAAADSLPVIRRGIELLDQGVQTGGWDALKLWAENRLGITGADEGELSANLGKAVLSQLRATFGAQFTEREGARLAEIEAGFGKSPEVNRRLLDQAQQLVERTARRGINAARASGDTETAQMIEEAMGMRLQYNDQGLDLTKMSDEELRRLAGGG